MTTQTPAGGRAHQPDVEPFDDPDLVDDADLVGDAGLVDEAPLAADGWGAEPRTARTVIGWLLLVGGLVGLLSSAALSIERVLLLENPEHTPSCSFNPLISCGQVMQSWQGELFGFPNPFIGVAAFPVVMTLGVAVLAGLGLPRWMWLSLWGGTVFGAAFITWLFIQSVYVIGKLCPYCMAVWVVMIPIFVYTTAHVLSERHLPAPGWLRRGIVENRGLIAVVWLLAIAIFIMVEFWDRWYLVF